jgi:hypothetical protein
MRPGISAADVGFVDTMRLSLCRRAKDEDSTLAGSEKSRRKMSFEAAKRRVTLQVHLSYLCPSFIFRYLQRVTLDCSRL